MENLDIYEKVREVPVEAQKEISGGKLNGKTDINPMWRIKKLTEIFGPCGVGWETNIINRWTEPGANGEVAAFVMIELRVKFTKGQVEENKTSFGIAADGWSVPIIGIGGSMLVNTEKGKLATNDECYKMAYTDAISIACKALGFGADIYWSQDATKYTVKTEETKTPKQEQIKCDRCGGVIVGGVIKGKERTAQEIKDTCGGLCTECWLKAQKGIGDKTSLDPVEV